jgi:hypothetical protein
MDGSTQRVAGDLGLIERMQMPTRDHQEGNPPKERMHDAQATRPDDRPCEWERAFTELTLLLPNWQLEGLERAASSRGVTTGQLLRRLIHNHLAGLDDATGQVTAVMAAQEDR